MTTREIEVAVAKFFDYRRHIIVPRVSWGLGVHECDMMVLTGSDYLKEIEIKISAGDLKKDVLKPHAHYSTKIRALFFAIPNALYMYNEFIPHYAGIITINNEFECRLIRTAKTNQGARKITAEEKMQLLRLGVMRYWNFRDLKEVKK